MIREPVNGVSQPAPWGREERLSSWRRTDPIRIVGLVDNAMQLYGCELGANNPVVFTGIGSGEELFEAILPPRTAPTRHSSNGLFVARIRVLPLYLL